MAIRSDFLILRFIYPAKEKEKMFVSRPVGRSTVRIRDFILRSPGAIGAL